MTPRLKKGYCLLSEFEKMDKFLFVLYFFVFCCFFWVCNWLKRYDEEGIEGLQDRTKKAVDRLN